MDTENLTPKESFKLINQVIESTKKRYEKNGTLVTVWGVVTMVAALSQYMLIMMGKGHLGGWAWVFTMIPMFIGTIVLSIRKGKKQRSKLDVVGAAWFMAGSMAMLTGFVFGNKFGIAFTTAMFLPFCLATLVCGFFLKKKYMIVIAILATILAYSALFIPFVRHPLLVAGMALLLFILPGLLLRADYRKRNTA